MIGGPQVNLTHNMGKIMTNVFLGAIIGILIFGIGKIYNRIDEIGRSLESRSNDVLSKIIERLDNIENYLFEIDLNLSPEPEKDDDFIRRRP